MGDGPVPGTDAEPSRFHHSKHFCLQPRSIFITASVPTPLSAPAANMPAASHHRAAQTSNHDIAWRQWAYPASLGRGGIGSST